MATSKGNSGDRDGRPPGNGEAPRDGANGSEGAENANVLRPGRRRSRERGDQAPRTKRSADQASTTAPTLPAHNSLRATRAAPATDSGRKAPAERATRAERRSAPDRATVPEDVRERFVQVGKTFYFPNGERAFQDRGLRLTTQSENHQVIHAFVEIAAVRGWQEVTVNGTQTFRQHAWHEARLAGLDVRGYTPTPVEEQQLVRAIARRPAAARIAPNLVVPPDAAARDASLRVAAARERATRQASGAQFAPDESTSERAGRRAARTHDGAPRDLEGLPSRVRFGRLIDHGRETYKFDPQGPMSYFVRLETPRGQRDIWGKYIEEAFEKSVTRPKIGDEVGVLRLGREPVTVQTRERDADGRVIREEALATHRNRWRVEARELFEERAEQARLVRDPRISAERAVAQYPALAGTYATLHKSELAAKERIADPADQRQFVARIRHAVADAIGRGEPLPTAQLRERDVAREMPTRAVEREQARVPG